MRVVYEAANVIDAHLVRQALEHAGLPAWVRGEALTGGMGELGVFGLVAVMVPDDCSIAAREVVEALQLGTPGAAGIEVDDAGPDDVPGAIPA
jgi:hypothetical protein